MLHSYPFCCRKFYWLAPDVIKHGSSETRKAPQLCRHTIFLTTKYKGSLWIFPQSNDMRITTVGDLSFGAGFGSPGALAFRQSCGMPWHLALEGWLVEMVDSIDGDTQQMDGLYWKILLKWMIWGYSYFKKPPKRSPTCQMHRSL